MYALKIKTDFMYKTLIRPFLFKLNPESAHQLTMKMLKIAGSIPFCRSIIRLMFKREHKNLSREVFGIRFPNPVGLAGGLDKNGECYNELSDFGFGFVEIGSLTAKPQPGNPKPRLFRVVKDNAIINRMGINNNGVSEAIKNINSLLEYNLSCIHTFIHIVDSCACHLYTLCQSCLMDL